MEQPKALDRKIDMDAAEWLILGLRPGQAFLSTRAFNCPVCGWKSDRWVMSNRPHAEPHLVCPNDHLPRYLRVLH